MHDLVLRGGTLVDGTGAPRFVGDVAIEGDRIVAVGVVPGRGRREIDCAGLLVTPGWVDFHTHYDGQATWDPHCSPSGWHGVTTVVMGNCGVGFAPVRAADREWIINTMEGVEDIPGSALTEGITWDWETFPEYLDALATLPRVLDVATQVPHAAVRAWVMGHQAAENVDATPAQVLEMKAIVKEALAAGALGFTTSRTPLHKTSEGVLVAGTHAPVEELHTIAEALAEVGHGVVELANEHERMGEDIAWMRTMAERTGRPVVFNFSQPDTAPRLYERLLAELDRAEADGVPLYGQVAGRSIGILMSWEGTAHPFRLSPTFVELWASLPHEALLARLAEPEIRDRLIQEEPFHVGEFEAFVTGAFHKMWEFHGDYEPPAEESLAARAARLGVPPRQLAYEALMREGGTGTIYFPLFNYADGDLAVLHRLHSHPHTRMGLSDGGAHCGAICDAGMPTFMLTHWTRDRVRGPRFPLERIVHRQTQQTASFYGLLDRGVLAPGYRADVNVIDFERLGVEAPEMVHDLPAGGRRLVQRAHGYRATICAGQVTFEEGVPTGALPGGVIRGPQPAPDTGEAVTR